MKIRFLVLGVFLLALSMACNTLSGGSAPPAAPTATTAPASAAPTLAAPQSGGGENPTPTQSQPTKPPPAESGSAPPAEVQDITALAQSYRLEIHMTWEPESGDPQPTDVLMEHVSDPLAEYLRISSPDGEFETYQIGDEMWMCSEGDCFYSRDAGSEAAPIMGGEDSSFQSDMFADPNVFTQKVGMETVNGFESTRYIVTLPPEALQDMSEGEMSNLHTEAWITTPGKYPPFLIRWTATWDEVRNGVAGKSSLTYEVRDVDAEFTISPPEGAAGGSAGGESGGMPGGNAGGGGTAAGIPAYPNAQVVASMGGYSMLTTSDDVQTVASFYTQSLADAGWSQQTDSTLGGMVIQTWTQGDKTLSLTIAPDEASGTTNIIITTE